MLFNKPTCMCGCKTKDKNIQKKHEIIEHTKNWKHSMQLFMDSLQKMNNVFNLLDNLTPEEIKNTPYFEKKHVFDNVLDLMSLYIEFRNQIYKDINEAEAFYLQHLKGREY